MEKSYTPFLEDHTHDVHHRYSVFDTGIRADGLAENYFVCLDIYRQYLHTEIKTKKEAWMLFLGSQSVEHILEVCDAFPEFIPLYERIFSYRKEASDMADIYYEALQIMNRNTELYMVEELQKEIQEEQKKLQAQQKKSQEQQKKMQEEIDQKDSALAQLQEDKKQQEMEIQRLREQLAVLQGK
jgi:septin family protein